MLAAMALAILAASGVAGAIINGEPDGNRHPYVGMVYNDEFLCSGALISPTVFLTAGHCTEVFKEGNSQVWVTFEPRADVDPDDAYTGTPYTHPRYCVGCAPGIRFLRFDVGVVVLDEAVNTGAGYAKLPTAGRVDALRKGTLLTAVEYGTRNVEHGGGPPQPADPFIRYMTEVKLINIDNAIGDMFIKHSGASAGEGQQGVCKGDSGGPVFLPDQRTVVGIVSWGSFFCSGPSYAQRVDLGPVLRWVRSFP